MMGSVGARRGEASRGRRWAVDSPYFLSANGFSVTDRAEMASGQGMNTLPPGQNRIGLGRGWIETFMARVLIPMWLSPF